MSRLWLVARHQYATMAGKRSFLLVTLGFPILIAVVMAIAFLFSTGRQDRRAAGYVDQAGVLTSEALAQTDSTFRPFEDLEDGQRALEAGQVQAVYVLPPDYLTSRRIELYYWDDPPGDAIEGRLRRALRTSVAATLPDEIRARAMQGAELRIQSADGRRQMGQDEWMSFVLPMVAGVLFVVAIMSSAGYLLQAVTTEKENRTMEVMITSVSPEQLMVGKALGLMAVSLTQLGIWALTGVVAVWIATRGLDLVRLGQVPWSTLGVILAFFFPGYALVGGMMAAIGSAVTEQRQGQQIASIINLVFMLPFFLVALLMAQPNSPLMVALTLFPPTAFLTVVLRWSVSIVPWWQLALSWLLLVASAGFSLWSAARILRAGMLRYGQRLSLRAALTALRSPSAARVERRS